MKDTRPPMDRIKFRAIGESNIRFGNVQQYGEDIEKLWAKGIVTIEDPISGVLQDFRMSDIKILEEYEWTFGEHDPETHMSIETEYDRYINDAYKEHMKASKEAGKGLQKDKMFTVGVGDGCAFYVITKVNKKSVRIEWRGFCPDHYVDMTLGYGGSFPKHCIEPHVGWGEALDEIFA